MRNQKVEFKMVFLTKRINQETQVQSGGVTTHVMDVTTETRA